MTDTSHDMTLDGLTESAPASYGEDSFTAARPDADSAADASLQPQPANQDRPQAPYQDRSEPLPSRNFEEEVKTLRTQLADLKASHAVETAVKGGRLPPALREHARTLYAQSGAEVFGDFLTKLAPFAALAQGGG